MRWIVAISLRLKYLVAGLAVALMVAGAVTLGHQNDQRVTLRGGEEFKSSA